MACKCCYFVYRGKKNFTYIHIVNCKFTQLTCTLSLLHSPIMDVKKVYYYIFASLINAQIVNVKHNAKIKRFIRSVKSANKKKPRRRRRFQNVKIKFQWFYGISDYEYEARNARLVLCVDKCRPNSIYPHTRNTNESALIQNDILLNREPRIWIQQPFAISYH